MPESVRRTKRRYAHELLAAAANGAGVTLNPQGGHTPAPDGAGLPSEEQNRFSNDAGEDRR